MKKLSKAFKKILIVDDDQAILEVIKIILETKGYQIIGVTNPKNIKDKIKTISPDLILLDIWMSGHDGSEITATLKKDPQTSHIPIIIISANNETEKIAQKSGANSFLAKPFDINNLIAKVEEYLL